MAGNGSSEVYRRTVRELSDRLVEAQRPIRILDAVKWDASVEEEFFRSRLKELPRVDRDYYLARPLGFDPEAKKLELRDLERDIARRLGSLSPIGEILKRMCREYLAVVEMLEARGLPRFSAVSQELYGSAADAFHAGEPTLAEFGEMMSEALAAIDRSAVIVPEEKTISGEEAVVRLKARLEGAFAGVDRPVRVMLNDGIVADAAAGSDYIKIRKEARFTERDIRLLEIHEGWVHLGTTINGSSQPVCTFLAKGPPSSTLTQEGLAILTEILTFASHPKRIQRLTNRVRGVAMAESGATFLDVFDFFRMQGFSELESYNNASRVFRGSTPTGGPFTKDLTYSKGFILTYNYILLAVRRGLLDRIQLLFCGKTTLEDLRILRQLVGEGIVEPPKFIPEPFRDLSALTAWMCYSNFLGRLDLERLETDYSRIL